MNLAVAVKITLSKYATFSGRATRSEYWWWLLAYVLIVIFVGVIDTFIVGPVLGFKLFDENAGQPLSLLTVVVLFLPNLAVAVRRLHDLDKSGWFVLIGVIPFIGLIILIYWFVQAGTNESNRFGSPAMSN